ncbi:hypothetical protein EYF80_066070 [Liparis tanakae]|uniref:Uncharacterized protein n=1 Tax=Liparis tanakae TaxID=230148 RepID=A0A4Z2E4Y8_9TELE|nr:hypothetical protein EYF80_066070 [Liparis tanakae]
MKESSPSAERLELSAEVACEMTRIPPFRTSLFSLARCRILSSMEPWQMRRYTVTCLVWPSRWARSMACWSTVGFQSLS